SSYPDAKISSQTPATTPASPTHQPDETSRFMLLIVGSFKVFEVVLLLTEGGPGVQSSVLSFEVYKQGFLLNDVGYASALAVLLFALILLLTTIIWQTRKRVIFHEGE